jgi:hypothetical protein
MWEITMCLQCKQWSPHPHWYHDPEPDQEKTREREFEHSDA